MLKKELIRKSKFLSLILRHNPARVGLFLDSAGWTSVEDLLLKTQMTPEDLDEVVENNDKKRFEFNNDKKRIRASQGHSIEVDLDYEERIPPEILYHGTAEGNLDSMRMNGIKKMGRHHVHLSAHPATARIVGSRHGKPVVLQVLSNQMHIDGYKFYLSTNGVWLVDYIDWKYIAEDMKDGKEQSVHQLQDRTISR